MDLVIEPNGQVRCLYDEAMELETFGLLKITRASHVEPDYQGRWSADLTFVKGPILGPFALRSEALGAERAWLERNWLTRSAP